jgi:putative ABC transport system permease protein
MRLDALRLPRVLTQSRGFSLCVILSLGVGISASSSVLALVDSMLHGRLPFDNADRIEVVHVGGRPLNERSPLVHPEIARALQGESSPLEEVATYAFRWVGVTDGELSANGAAYYASPGFPRMLSARMHIGRPFFEADRDDTRPVMLSHAFWTSAFASDSSIIGRSIRIEDVPHTVVGVTSPAWSYPDRTQLWIMNRAMLAGATPTSRVGLIGLRKRDIEAEQARAMIRTIGTAAMTVKGLPRDRIESRPLRAHLTRQLAGVITILSTIALFVGLLTAVNFAGLVLARGLRRRGELGVRAALGATLPRLVRTIVGESLVLCAIGGALAAVLAPGISALLSDIFSSVFPAWIRFGMSWRVVAASIAIAMVVGAVFGLGPALDLARPALGAFLKNTGAGASGSAGASRSRSAVVTVQVALATGVLVLLGAVLGRTLVLTGPNPGFDYNAIVLGAVRGSPVVRQAWPTVLAEIQTTPGIASAAAAHSRLASPGEVLFDQTQADASAFPFLWWAQTTETFHGLLGTRLETGRWPTLEEHRSGAPVAVVSRTVARRYGGDPVGRTIAIGTTRLTIVGVIADVRRNAWAFDEMPAAFSPMLGPATRASFTEVWARVANEGQLWPTLRELQERAGRRGFGAPVRFESVGERMRQEMRDFSAVARLVWGVFGIALALAALGIYGLVSYTAEMRNREMAIREALGASRMRVAGLLVGGAAAQTIAGLIAGALIATFVASFIQDERRVLQMATQSTALAAALVALAVLVASFGPIRATWRRDLAPVLRD